MPLGCIGSAIIGVDAVGSGSCTLAGTFNILSGLVPPAPFTTQDTKPQTKVAQSS